MSDFEDSLLLILKDRNGIKISSHKSEVSWQFVKTRIFPSKLVCGFKSTPVVMKERKNKLALVKLRAKGQKDHDNACVSSADNRVLGKESAYL